MTRIVVDYFFSPTSEECRNFMKLVINPLMRELSDSVEWRVHNIYDPKAKRLADQYGIKGVPALVIAGKEVIFGFKPVSVIRDIITRNLGQEK
ncbi:MAG: hypothetical protein QXW47_03950 [Candidatus Jordarchaeales archaeon]|nr:hypothetical protein [Candidatus Jordarchaeia archaeon]